MKYNIKKYNPKCEYSQDGIIEIITNNDNYKLLVNGMIRIPQNNKILNLKKGKYHIEIFDKEGFILDEHIVLIPENNNNEYHMSITTKPTKTVKKYNEIIKIKKFYVNTPELKINEEISFKIFIEHINKCNKEHKKIDIEEHIISDVNYSLFHSDKNRNIYESEIITTKNKLNIYNKVQTSSCLKDKCIVKLEDNIMIYIKLVNKNINNCSTLIIDNNYISDKNIVNLKK